MVLIRSSYFALALRRSAPAAATSRIWGNDAAYLTLRRLAPAAAASRFSIGGCGSPRSIYTEQEVEKSMEKSKQRLLNLYLNGQTDNNRELTVKSVEEELDYISHLQDKAARARCAAKRLSEMESEERYFHFLDTVVAPAGVMLMFVLTCISGLPVSFHQFALLVALVCA